MFFSKNKGPSIKDVIYLNERGLYSAVARWMRDNPTGLVASWFQQDLDRLREAIPGIAVNNTMLADRLAFHRGSDKPILFAGHHPLRKNELELGESLGLSDILVYSHLAMPMLRYFGADKISDMMVKMGMKEDEPLTHAMITKSIANAQDKIAEKCVTDMHANSEEEWIKMNVDAGK